MMGYILVNTGNGKGKTTSAIGTVVRAVGWSKKSIIIQFLKSMEFETGERLFFERNAIEIISGGVGYSWQKPEEEQKRSIKETWDKAKEILSDNSYFLVILDEINTLWSLNEFDVNDIITVEEVIYTLNNRPENQSVILTGRNAPKEILDIADTVTEMKEIKHYFNKGINAVKGLDF